MKPGNELTSEQISALECDFSPHFKIKNKRKSRNNKIPYEIQQINREIIANNEFAIAVNHLKQWDLLSYAFQLIHNDFLQEAVDILVIFKGQRKEVERVLLHPHFVRNLPKDKWYANYNTYIATQAAIIMIQHHSDLFTGFDDLTPEQASGILIWKRLKLDAFFYNEVLETPLLAENANDLFNGNIVHKTFSEALLNSEMLNVLKTKRVDTLSKFEAYFILMTHQVPVPTELTTPQAVGIQQWSRMVEAGYCPSFYAEVLNTPLLADNVVTLSQHINQGPLSNSLLNSDVLDVLKTLKLNTPDEFQAYAFLRANKNKAVRELAGELKLSDIGVKVICLLSITLMHLNRLDDGLFESWLKLLLESSSPFLECLSNLIRAEVTAKELSSILGHPEGFDLLKNKVITSRDGLLAYDTLLRYGKTEVKPLNFTQISAINGLNTISLDQPIFLKCLDEIVNEETSLFSLNLSKLFGNKIQEKTIALTLQNEEGFQSLKTKKAETPEMLLAYQFLLAFPQYANNTLSSDQAHCINELVNIYESVLNFQLLLDALTEKNEVFCRNLMILKRHEGLRTDAMLKAIDSNVSWVLFLKENNLAAYTYCYDFRVLLEAYITLLFAGNTLNNGVITITQARLIQNPQIREKKSQEIYQKIIDDEHFMAALFKLNDFQMEAAFIAIILGKSADEIEFCKQYQAPYLSYMLQVTNNDADKASYAIQFCQSLQELKDKLPDFHQRGEIIAGQKCMELYVSLYGLMEKYFNPDAFNFSPWDEFNNATNEIILKYKDVLEQHRGILGTINALTSPLLGYSFFTTNTVKILNNLQNNPIEKILNSNNILDTKKEESQQNCSLM